MTSSRFVSVQNCGSGIVAKKVHGLIGKRRRSPGLAFVSLVRLGAICPPAEQKAPCLWLSCPGLICPVLLHAPNVKAILPPFLLPCTLACYELQLEVLSRS